VDGLRASGAERDVEQRDLESERIALTLRAEKAEANGIASNNEMLVTRQSAQIISPLF
jgi:hypothetical protein